MPTDAEYRRCFERLRQGGELEYLLALVRERMTTAEQRLTVKLRTVLVTEPKELAELHAIQGRLSAYADLMSVMRKLAEPATAPVNHADLADNLTVP